MELRPIIVTVSLVAAFVAVALWIASQRPGLFDTEVGGTAPAWATTLRELDRGLSAGDLTVADSAWPQAWSAAVASRRWEALIAVGDSTRRLGELSDTRPQSDAKARRAYRLAYHRAQTEGSLEGLLRAAEAFAELGDRDVVQAILGVTYEVAAKRDLEVRQRVNAAAARISARLEPRSGPGPIPATVSSTRTYVPDAIEAW
jgi:hypothetical protein